MGLNVKDIQLRLCKVAKLSSESSYTFLQKHPLVSGALLVCFILYIFLSYIYSFLVYMSPFLLCGAIFVRIFWSSEQTQLRYVKKEEEKEEQKRVETKCPKIPNNGRQLLYKYPSQNATSRRRNFTGKKWDVYGGLEEKAKDLSAVFHNEFTKRTTEKGESSLNYGLSTKRFQAPKRQTLRSEPSMVDLVEYGGSEIDSEKMENGDDEDEEEAQEDRNKAIEWTEDDQKNLMDLGVSEMERNRRLEILIARRRARKLLKPQLDNGLIDKKSITPNHIAPVLTRRGNLFDYPKDFEGIDDLEMPGSAPSMIPRSPYDIPYDPSEEKPNLTEDSFLQEVACQQKDMPFCRHESFLFPSETKQDHGVREPYSFNNGRNRPAYSRFRRIPDKGNHDWLIDKLNYNEGGESGLLAPISLRKGEESTHEEDGKCKTDMAEVKDEKVENAHDTNSMSALASDPGLIPNISNVATARVPRFPTHHEKLKLPFPTTTNESMLDTIPSPADKRQENMFLTDRRICHTPTYSIASDLQVEVSEVGSLASTVDEVGETNSSTDRESVEYDGDIDRDVSSGSEELWGASFHGRGEAHGVRYEEDIVEINNNSKDIVSTPLALRQIDEENVADVSSLSSRSDMPEDTPTCAINSAHNIFGYMKYTVEETEAPQSSLSSYTVDQLPNEIHSEQPEEWSNMSEDLINEAHVTNDVNNSAATEQDNTENSRSNEDPGTSVVRQESIDEASIYSISSSPRSVLPEKTIADGVTSSAYDQEMNIDAQQSNMEDMAQETLNGERPPDILPQNIQSLMDDTSDESQHNVDLNHSREQANPPENSIEESNMFGKMNDEEICNKEEQDKLKNDENSEDNSTNLIRQEATAESTTLINERTTMEVMDEKSRDSVNDKTELVEGDHNDQAANSNSHEDLPQPRVTEPTIPSKEANEGS